MSAIYQPLHEGTSLSAVGHHASSWEFRLLKLFGGRSEAAIACEMSSTTARESDRRYEALSYVWGDPRKAEIITVNGTQFPVTSSLHQSLTRLRYPDNDRSIWVDAVCINQSNLSERSLQVRRMGSIYRRAQRVVVFLGSEADRSSQAMALLDQLSDLAHRDHDALTAILEDPAYVTAWKALLSFFARPWWTRAWIIQEYVVSADVVFLCGDRELSGQSFGRALDNLIDYRFNAAYARRHENLIRHVAQTPIHHLWSTRRSYHENAQQGHLRALDVLYKFRGSQCLDTRDKVFSIWDLIKHHPSLAPEYSKDTQSVFRAVVKAAIEDSGNLEVLTHHNRSVESTLGLPTWCPDWTVRRGKRILLWRNGYQACGSLRHTDATVVDSALVLRGRKIATIEQLRLFQSDDFRRELSIRQALCELEQQVIAGTYPDVDHAARLEAYCQTLVAARVRPDGPQGKSQELLPGEGTRMWDAWRAAVDGPRGQGETRDAKLYRDALYSALSGRCVLTSNANQLGLVDGTARAGDSIFVFAGGEVPFAVRCSGDGSKPQTFELVGEW